MIRALRIWAIALSLMLSIRGNVFAQIAMQPETNITVTEPKEIVPLDSLIRYPEKARENGIEGDVMLLAKVLTNSTATKAEIIRSDNPIFDDEAIRVIETAGFEPAEQLGKPHPFWIIRTIHFRLNHNVSSEDAPLRPAASVSCQFVDVDQEPHERVPLESLIHYPKEAKKKGIEGNITVNALIDTNGKAIKVNVLNPSNPVFNAEALRVLKVARFTPAKQSGTPLKLWITRTIHFRLKKNDGKHTH